MVDCVFVLYLRSDFLVSTLFPCSRQLLSCLLLMYLCLPIIWITTSACWLSLCLALLKSVFWYIVRLGPLSLSLPITIYNRKNSAHWSQHDVFFLDHEHYEDHLLSVWSRNPEFAHRHNVSVSGSPCTPSVTLSHISLHPACPELPVPSVSDFLVPAWPSVPGITALGVGVRAVIPRPVGGPLCL